MAGLIPGSVIYMKKCPNCKNPNDDRNAFCKSCGHALKVGPRPRPFRNFVITVSILFSIILMVLIVLFFTNSDLAETFFHRNTTVSRDEEASTPDEDSIDPAGIEGTSPDQKRVLSTFGDPDQFIILFDEGAGNKRIDSWMYIDTEVCFIFEDGIYAASSEYIVEESGKNGYIIKPYEFKYGMAPPDVEIILGEKGMTVLEEKTGLKLLIFGEGAVICVFNDDDGLIGISKNIISEDLY